MRMTDIDARSRHCAPLPTLRSHIAHSHPEQLAVARVDLLARRLDAGGVLLHGLDIAERLAAGLLLHLAVHGAHSAEIDDELLAFRGKAIALEQPRRIRVRRILEDGVRPHHGRNALGRIDELDRTAALLEL